MKALIPLVVTGALVAAAPAFAQDVYVTPGYAPGYVAPSPGYVTTTPGYVASPGFVSGPFGILALPFQIATQIATLPFRVLVPANGALAPTATALVPANPDCGVVHDWNGRYTSVCGL